VSPASQSDAGPAGPTVERAENAARLKTSPNKSADRTDCAVRTVRTFRRSGGPILHGEGFEGFRGFRFEPENLRKHCGTVLSLILSRVSRVYLYSRISMCLSSGYVGRRAEICPDAPHPSLSRVCARETLETLDKNARNACAAAVAIVSPALAKPSTDPRQIVKPSVPYVQQVFPRCHTQTMISGSDQWCEAGSSCGG
jgi:hypothetical protein